MGEKREKVAIQLTSGEIRKRNITIEMGGKQEKVAIRPTSGGIHERSIEIATNESCRWI
jgi:hypothetical protein